MTSPLAARVIAAKAAYADAEAAGWTGTHLDAYAAEIADAEAALDAHLAAARGPRPVGGYRGARRAKPARRSYA